MSTTISVIIYYLIIMQPKTFSQQIFLILIIAPTLRLCFSRHEISAVTDTNQNRF